jgi:hypothetical protein
MLAYSLSAARLMPCKQAIGSFRQHLKDVMRCSLHDVEYFVHERIGNPVVE